MNASEASAKDTAQRLHIGGKQVKEGWKILNIQPGEGVEFVGDAADLSQFDDEMFDDLIETGAHRIHWPRHCAGGLPFVSMFECLLSGADRT